MERNVFLYWVGKEYKLISLLRNLIYLHSKNGKGYKVHLINHSNINEYIKDLPECFYSLSPAHQADFVRVHVICDYGGIWMDSDVIVMTSLDSLFELNDGFFVLENNQYLYNGFFGCKKNSELLKQWKKEMLIILNEKKENIHWTEIGNTLLTNLWNNNYSLYYKKYTVLKGLNTLYPIKWDECVSEYIQKPYDNYKTIIRNYQPVIILVNSVYKLLEDLSEYSILNGKMPINYFINTSFNNMTHLIDYDFIEIGTSNFDSLIEKANDNTKGISVEPIKYYLDSLPNKQNVMKLNVGISNKNTTMNIYYIPETDIIKNNLPEWFKGCNSVNDYHPLHKKHNVTHMCIKEKVNIITAYELFYQNKVGNLQYLKIDTEGHDCIILESLFNYLNYLPKNFYPKKILFESNEHIKQENVNKIILLYIGLGYTLINKGYDTLLQLI